MCVSLHLFCVSQTLKHPPGANIIGVLPGTYWGTSRDRPVVVAAHWDTVPNTPGWSGGEKVLQLKIVAKFVLTCTRNII